MKEATGPILLSIDWDWVTGDCADEHDHCGWCVHQETSGRRGMSVNVGRDWKERLRSLLNLPYSAGHFWVAECHADILQVVNPKLTSKIIHLDSHMDDADWFGLCCGSWRTFLPHKAYVETWKADMINKITKFHDVFVCQSSPWTPSFLDASFWELVEHISNKMGTEPEFIGHMYKDLMMDWNTRGYKIHKELR